MKISSIFVLLDLTSAVSGGWSLSLPVGIAVFGETGPIPPAYFAG